MILTYQFMVFHSNKESLILIGQFVECYLMAVPSKLTMLSFYASLLIH